MKDYNTALKINPNNSYAYIDRAELYLKLSKIEQEEKEDNNNLSLFEEQYKKENKIEKAISDFSEAILRNPNATYSYYSRMKIYWDLSEYNACQEFASCSKAYLKTYSTPHLEYF